MTALTTMTEEKLKILMDRLIDRIDYPPVQPTVRKQFEIEQCVKIIQAIATRNSVGLYQPFPEDLADQAFRVYDRLLRNIPGAEK